MIDNRAPLRGGDDCAGAFTSDVVAGSCPRAADVSGSAANRLGLDPVASGAARAFGYPLDLVRVRLPGCASAEIEVTVHRAGADPCACPDFNDDQWSFRYYGPRQPGVDATLGWHDFAARATRVGPRTWRLRLDANQFGSYRPGGESVLFVGGRR